MLADNLDVIVTIPTENMGNAPTDLGDRYATSPASTFQFLAVPTFQTEYAKPEVRKAISMAIDRDEIIKSIFKNSQASARSFVSPVVGGYREDTCGASCQFNAATAKAQYTAAGGPAKIQISYNGDGGHKDWVDATCNQLKTNLGVDCTGVAEAKFADLLTKVEAKQNVGLFRMGWVMDYPSMENYLGPIFTTNGSSNYYGYSNPTSTSSSRRHQGRGRGGGHRQVPGGRGPARRRHAGDPAALRPEQLRLLVEGAERGHRPVPAVDLFKIEAVS